jgi:hypothetical protein
MEFEKSTRLPVSAEALYRWHMRPGAFHRLVPPFQRVRVLDEPDGIAEGVTLTMKVYQGPIGLRWVAEHKDFVEGRQFVDEQSSGPFAAWRHTHTFEPAGPDACRLVDHIDYRLPMGPIGRLVGGRSTRHMLQRMFDFRHTRTRLDLMRHTSIEDERTLTVAMTGASGLIGRHLTHFLTTGGHEVRPLVRDRQEAEAGGGIYWNIDDDAIDAEALEGVDAVVHLAGENIFGRWTEAKKRRIMESRRKGTRLLSEALAGLDDPPEVLVSASGIDYYGARGTDPVDESDGPGEGFLADVCQAWERSADPAREAGIRTVHTRFGLVLSAEGGGLKTMLPAFKMGVGGRIGSGNQYFPWVHIDDVLGIVHFAIFNDELEGPVNAVSPQSVTNSEFTQILGDVLSRPTWIPVPEFGVKLLFGQMGEEALLSGVRARPKKLEEAGYEWAWRDLREALEFELGQ